MRLGALVPAALAALLAAGCDFSATGQPENPGPSVRAQPGVDPHAALGPDRLLQVALQHRMDGRPGEAMDVLGRAIAEYPEHAGLLGARGALRLEQKRFSAALTDLEAAVRYAPKEPGPLTNRAQAYRQFERTDEALADLDRAIALDPDFVPARFNRGALLFTRGEYQRALEDFDRCVKVEPQAAAPHFNRAVTRDALGQGALAIADLERFLELTENEAWKAPARELLASWRARADNAAGTQPASKRGG